MGKKKPEEMSVAEYNKQMMDDAFAMLVNALGELNEADSKLSSALTNVRRSLKEIYQAEQLRLDV